MDAIANQATRAPERSSDTWIGAVQLAIGAAILAFGTNALRTDGLSLIAQKDFDIVVPCPEPVGSATLIEPADPRLREPNTLVIDARSAQEYRAWHLPGAINTPLDWLAEQDTIAKQAQQLAREIAHSKKASLVVYGDGEDPDSGQQWAASLNSAGIRNVYFVRGGAPALKGETRPDASAKEQP